MATSDSAGNVVDKYTYSPYGESGPEGDSGFPFRFTGQKLDPETGLYNYKARFYDPEVGRFLQTDPIGYADGMNMYAYVGNDPVNKDDPTGTEQGISAVSFITKHCYSAGCELGGGGGGAGSSGGGGTSSTGYGNYKNTLPIPGGGLTHAGVTNFFGGAVKNPISGGSYAPTSSNFRYGNHANAGIITIVKLSGSFQYDYLTPGETRIAAASEIGPLTVADPSNPVEYNVLILQRGSGKYRRYAYSNAVTNFYNGIVTGSAKSALRRSLPEGTTIFGELHSHPGNIYRGQIYAIGPDGLFDAPGTYVTDPSGCVYRLSSDFTFRGTGQQGCD